MRAGGQFRRGCCSKGEGGKGFDRERGRKRGKGAGKEQGRGANAGDRRTPVNHAEKAYSMPFERLKLLIHSVRHDAPRGRRRMIIAIFIVSSLASWFALCYLEAGMRNVHSAPSKPSKREYR